MKRLPPLNALRAFDAAVRTGSFTRAGEVLHAPMVERDLAEQRLRRLDTHELTGVYGYWFVEPREHSLRDPAHGAVVALFQSWLLDVSRRQAAAEKGTISLR